MWWWGPCAGASCCVDVVVHQPTTALYDELVPLLTDGRRCGPRSACETDDSDIDAQYALRASVSGIAVEPGIYRARDVRTHDAVALKVFDKALLKNTAARRRLREEIHVISQCEHPNILRLYGVYASKRTFQIAFQLASGGEVMHRIAASTVVPSPVDGSSPPRYRVTEREIARVIASAAAAIQFMHGRGLVHGEMRPEHLLYSDLEPDARVLVVDFGRASAWRHLTFKSRVHRGKFLWHDRHSLRFLPPAIVQRMPLDGVPDWPHAQQVDIWSLGVTMYVLLCGAFPFDGASLEDIRSHIVHEKLAFPSHHPVRRRTTDTPDNGVKLSRAARDLLIKMLEKDPYKAPSIDDVCAHPWLSSDVAAEVRWSDAQIREFEAFAHSYQHAVAVSSLRRPTLGHHEAIDSSSSSRLLQERDEAPRTSPTRHSIYGSSARNEDDTFDADAERPSFVSTDGNIQVKDTEERLSADAYMRLASAELDSVTAENASTSSLSPRLFLANGVKPLVPPSSQPQPTSGLEPLEEDHSHQPPVIKGEFWPLFSRQRRRFSFKSLSFRSGSSGGSKDEDR